MDGAMFRLELPGLPSTPERASQSVRDIAEDAHPGLGHNAEHVTSILVAHALHYTPRWGLITIGVEVTNAGIEIEVCDPGDPQSEQAARDLSSVDKLAFRSRLSRSAEQHVAWVDLRVPEQVTA